MSFLSHDDLVSIAERWLKSINCGVVFNDKFKAATGNGEQPDALGFKSGVSIMIECKASRSDFLSDKNKRFRIDPTIGIGDWRFYMCPPDVIKVEDLPEGWGLLWTDGKRVKKVYGIPTNTQLQCKRPFDGNKRSEQDILVSALRRLSIRGYFDHIYQSLDEFRVRQSSGVNDLITDNGDLEIEEKPHGNTGKKNALKSGRSKQIGAVRVTPIVYDYLKSGGTSAADKIERLVMNELHVSKTK